MAFKMKAGAGGPMRKNFPGAFKDKDKIVVDTATRDYYTDAQKKEYDKLHYGELEKRAEIDESGAMRVVEDAGQKRADRSRKESGTTIHHDASKNEYYAGDAGRRRQTKVKIKGGKRGEGHVLHPDESNIEDIKKIKLTQGKGRERTSTKIKYDKEGNVKKVVNRRGVLGLKKGKGVRVGDTYKTHRRGKDAAEEVLAKTTTGKVRGEGKTKRTAG